MARILVVDDDDQMRELIAQMLERGDEHVVVGAATGSEAVESFQADASDLAVIDLQLPGELNGWATMRVLHELSPHLPFLVISGGGALEGLEKGSAGTLHALQGLSDYRILRKPFDWAELTEAVAALLPQDRSRRLGMSP